MYRNNYTQRGFADNSQLSMALSFGIIFLILACIAITSVGRSNYEVAEQATKQQERVVTTPTPPQTTEQQYTAQDVVMVAGGVGLMVLIVGGTLIWFTVQVIADTPVRQSPKPKKAKTQPKKISSFGGTERVIK